MSFRERYKTIKELGRLQGLSSGGIELSQLDTDDLCRVLDEEPGLQNLILKLINWQREKEQEPLLECLPDALEEVRDRVVRSAAMGFSLAASNRSGICEGFDYDKFWSLSLARGVAAFSLSRELKVGNPEEVFVCAFLFRFGALVLAGTYPTRYSEMMKEGFQGEASALLRREQVEFGIDHVQLSQALFEDLSFPREFNDTFRSFCVDSGQEGGLSSLIESAERMAHLCVFESDNRAQRWRDLLDLRTGLNIETEEFTALGDTLIRHWWEWGDELHIPTQPTSILTLLDSIEEQEPELANLEDVTHPQFVQGQRLRILAVDDDAMSVRMLQRQLELGGHEVYTATNGRDALQAVLQHSPHVVVADWVMPEMDGLDLCRALRRYEAGKHIFFLLLTGREEEEHMIEAFDAGVDDFETKPTRPRVLLARIRAAQRVLDLRRQIVLDHRLLREQLGRLNLLARKLRDTTVTDSLTELPNRRYAVRRMSEEWASCSRQGTDLSLLLLDIDNFKMVNDTLGHEMGDEVLKSFAKVLQATSRRGEVACRFGGEEFVVICRDSDSAKAVQCAERIRSAVEESDLLKEHKLSLTTSIGVATRTPDAADVGELLRRADSAVYSAKHNGRNRCEVWSAGKQ